jgi:hypothetical protein
MATFVISATTATFGAMIRGASQGAGDLETLSVGVHLADETAWRTLESLVTTKYHVHVPMSGTPIVDVVRGPGAGTLTISGGVLTTATAILIVLRRDTYTRNTRTTGSAQFLLTSTWS